MTDSLELNHEDVAIDRLSGRVRDLEAALQDLISESLQRDNRGPQPALQRAIKVLHPAALDAAPAAMPDADWTVVGGHFGRALGVVAH